MSLTEPAASAQRPPAAARVRPPSRPPVPPSDGASPQEIRKFGVVILIGFGLIAALLAWRAKPLAAEICAGVGASVGLFSLLFPRAARPVHRAWMAVAGVLGRINTTILLSLFYLVMVTGFGLVFRLIRRDALRMRRRPADSYWVPKKISKDAASYFNQY